VSLSRMPPRWLVTSLTNLATGPRRVKSGDRHRGRQSGSAGVFAGFSRPHRRSPRSLRSSLPLPAQARADVGEPAQRAVGSPSNVSRPSGRRQLSELPPCLLTGSRALTVTRSSPGTTKSWASSTWCVRENPACTRGRSRATPPPRPGARRPALVALRGKKVGYGRIPCGHSQRVEARSTIPSMLPEMDVNPLWWMSPPVSIPPPHNRSLHKGADPTPRRRQSTTNEGDSECVTHYC
jgi:hypothetical protein